MPEIAPNPLPSIQPVAQAGSTSQSLGGLGPDAFLKLLVAQLRYQNPMEPSDGSQLLQQTADFTQVETLKSLAESQEQLKNLTQFSLAIGLAGKQVTAYDSSGNNLAGEVGGVRFASTGPEVEIDSVWVPMTNVVEVSPER